MSPRTVVPLGRGRWLVGALACACAIALDCATLRFLWMATEIVGGQYQLGYFEEPEGIASMVLDDAQRTSVQPDVGLTAAGDLSLPPGRTIGLPLMQGVEYRIRIEDRDWAPFCIFGRREQLADDGRPPAFRVSGARTLHLRDGALGEADWAVVRPWRDDQVALAALASRCGTDGSDRIIAVRARDGHIDAQIGSCTQQLHGNPDVLVVIAGPAWTTAQKSGGWQIARTYHVDVVVIVVALALLRFVTTSAVVGYLWAAALAGILFLWAWLIPATGIAIWVLALVVGVASAGLSMLWSAGKDASTIRVAAGYLLLLVPTALAVLPFLPSYLFSAEEPPGPAARCLMLGYSSMRGDSLRQDLSRGAWGAQGGAWDVVKSLPACAGSIERRARAAGRFSWNLDVLCGSQPSLLPGGRAVFLGGSNDDFLWAPFQAWRVAQVARLARYAYDRPNANAARLIATMAEEDSLAALEQQTQVIGDVLGCVARQHAHFLYFHDFLAWDLADPRSPPRQQMLLERARAIRQGGGTFVDLLAEVADEAGVFWFNDYIHPSEIGHRRIGELMTRVLRDVQH